MDLYKPEGQRSAIKKDEEIRGISDSGIPIRFFIASNAF